MVVVGGPSELYVDVMETKTEGRKPPNYRSGLFFEFVRKASYSKNNTGFGGEKVERFPEKCTSHALSFSLIKMKRQMYALPGFTG